MAVSNTNTFKWFYESSTDYGSWWEYSPQHCTQLENAFSQKVKNTKLQINSQNYNIDMWSMKQTLENCQSSNQSRRIVRAMSITPLKGVAGSSTPNSNSNIPPMPQHKYKWFYECTQEKGSWLQYSDPQIEELEDAFLDDEKMTSLHINGAQYGVNLQDMIQFQINNHKRCRKIVRCSSITPISSSGDDVANNLDSIIQTFPILSVNSSTGSRQNPVDIDEDAFKDLGLIVRDTPQNLKTYLAIWKLRDHKSFAYQMIHTYVENGHCPNHNFKMKISNIYKVKRLADPDFENNGEYRMLLWHGTKQMHMAGILKNGFKRPAAHQTGRGLMYGTGIYFADRASKSAGYCDGTSAGKVGYMFLCDVSMGKVYKAGKAHSEFNNPPYVNGVQYDTVKGTGQNRPTWSENKTYYGAIAPVGQNQVDNRYTAFQLMHNEYIAYDPKRVAIKFIVEIKFA